MRARSSVAATWDATPKSGSHDEMSSPAHRQSVSSGARPGDMASNLIVGITIGATLGAAYRRVFTDATVQLKQLGESYQKTNRELLAAGALVKYKRELDAVKKKHAEVGSSADEQGLSPRERGNHVPRRVPVAHVGSIPA